tara:strand:- start:42 stop:500 length:459 start_codon:yes stop_codon:yes gene_type:complete
MPKKRTIDLKGFLKDAQQIAKDHPLILMTLAVTLAYAARGDKEKLRNMLATVKNTISGGGKPKDALEAVTSGQNDLPKTAFPTTADGTGLPKAAAAPNKDTDPGLFAPLEQRRRSRRRRTRSRRRRSLRSRSLRSRSRRRGRSSRLKRSRRR